MEWLKRENPLCIKTETAAKLSQGIFWITYALYLTFRTAAETTYRYDHSNRFFTYGVWICCFFALINIFFLCRYTTGQLLLILALTAFNIYVWFCTEKSDFIFLTSMTIIFSCRQVQWRRLLNFSFFIHIFLILIPGFLELIGILPPIEVLRDGSPRYSLGFSHPNVLGGYCLCLVIIWMLLRYRKLKVYDYLAWVAIAVFLWLVPNSKTSIFLILLLCLLTLIFKKWGDKLIKNSIIQSICLSFGWIMAAFSIGASYFYNADNPLYVQIDRELFTTRLSCAYGFLHKYPITLFGQKMEFVSFVDAQKNGTQSYILDNFYIHNLLQSGVITFLIVLILFTLLMYFAIRKHNQAMLIGLLIVLIYSVYENRGVNLVYNVLMFQIVYQLFGERENQNGKGIRNRAGL